MNFKSLLYFLQKPEIYKFVVVGICNGILLLILTGFFTSFIKYNIFALVGLGINLLVLFLLTNYLEIHYILSEGAAILVSFGFNYIASKKISFKN